MDGHAVSPLDLILIRRLIIISISLSGVVDHKTTHANNYYGAWPGWAVSISVLPLTIPLT